MVKYLDFSDPDNPTEKKLRIENTEMETTLSGIRSGEILEVVSSHLALLLSKLENQKTLPDRKKYRLDEQLREAILCLEPRWSVKNINFNLENLPEIIFFGNAPLLLQVWINIIGNAVKFVSENGNISVSAEETLNYVTVKIADDGIGMSEETKYRIFDKFYQGDTSRRSQGNGLGLTLCAAIVSRCGGTISVDSELKKGSVFTVRLPKAAN